MIGTMNYLEDPCDFDLDDLCSEAITSVLYQILQNVIGKVLTCLLEAL